MELTHIHSSSRWNRSAKSQTAASRKYNAVADFVTYTEVASEEKENAIGEANGSHFGLVVGDHGGKNDCGISYNHARLRLVGHENFKATKLTHAMGGGKRSSPLYATIAIFEDKQAHRQFGVAVIHLPSDVEAELSTRGKTERTMVWYSAFKNVKRRLNYLKRRYRLSAVLFVADFNINFKRRFARALVKTLAPLYTLTWRDLKFVGGTHGRRVIDGTLIRGSMAVQRSARLFADDVSSDHRPFIEDLRHSN